MAEPTEFVYRLPGSPGGSRPGAHRSHSPGPGFAFAGHARLFDLPDPRRLDLRASLRSPRREWLVRTSRQRSAVNIHVIVDVSASMHFGSHGQRKLDVAADLIAALGMSAFRQGDAVGLSAIDHQVRHDLFQPPRARRGVGVALAQRVRECVASPVTGHERCRLMGWLHGPGRSRVVAAESLQTPQALQQCASQLASRPALVLLVSDFHWSLDTLPQTLARLAPASVVPVVIWDRTESEPPAQTGWLTLQDVESGRYHSLWLSAARRQAWRRQVAERRQLIRTQCARRNSYPFFIEGRFDADALSRYFLESIA